MALELDNVRPAPGGGVILDFVDDGRARSSRLSADEVNVLFGMLRRIRAASGDALTVKGALLTARPPSTSGGLPSIGVVSAAFGNVMFELPWSDFAGLSSAAAVILAATPPDGAA